MRSFSDKEPDAGRVKTEKYPALEVVVPSFPPLIDAFAIGFVLENPARVKVQPASMAAV